MDTTGKQETKKPKKGQEYEEGRLKCDGCCSLCVVYCLMLLMLLFIVVVARFMLSRPSTHLPLSSVDV